MPQFQSSLVNFASLYHSFIVDSGDIEYQAEKSDLLVYCHAKKHLIKLFLTLNSIQDQGRDEGGDMSMSDGVELKDRTQSVAELLHITATEAEQFLGMVERYQASCLDKPSTTTVCGSPLHPLNKKQQKRAVEKEKESKVGANQTCQEDINIHDFLTCFVVSNSNHHLQQQQHQQPPASLSSTSSSSTSNNFQISLSDKMLLNSEMSLRLGKDMISFVLWNINF